MSDGAISQDEIDALLSGVAIDGLNSSGHVGNNPTYHFDIPTLQTMAEALKPKLLKLFALVNNEEATEVDDMVLSVVSELIATHISAEIQEVESKGKASGLGYATPETLNESKAMIMFPQGDFVLASYPLTYEGNAYTLWECIGGDAAEGLSKALGGIDEAASLNAAANGRRYASDGHGNAAANGRNAADEWCYA